MSASLSPACQNDLVLLLQAGTLAGLSDSQLLDQFLTRRDTTGEAAFAAIVNRHGPMVLRVCMDVLGNSADAHDAFQATFLVLVRRAGSIRQRNSVQSWLFGVARRVVAQVKIDAARRRRIEHQAAALRVVHGQDGEDEELRLIVAEELARLPEKYRAPVLLCDMEGLTYDAAARRLGCPAGTVGIRLMRARDRLRGRLTRRGIGLSSVAIAAWVGSQRAHAGVSPELVAAVVKVATQRATASATSIVAELADRTLSGRFVFRATIAAGLLVAAGAAVTLALAFASARENSPSQPIGVTGPGSQHARDQAAVPETVITLKPGGALRIRGTVVDSETGKPIPSFRIVPGVMGGVDIWLFEFAGMFRDGHYQIAPFLHNDQHLIRIEAKGYKPAVSPVFGRDSGEQVFDARLVKGPWLDGTVRGTSGGPLEGAEVFWSPARASPLAGVSPTRASTILTN